MTWHQNPRLVDLLAGEYALGTLQGGARRRFEKLLARRPDLAEAVARWNERMASTQLPESYVGVLGLADGRPGLIVSSLRQGHTVDVKRLAAVPVPAGQVLYLWSLDAAGKASPVAPLPQGAFVHLQLGAPSESVFARAVELAVSVEREASSPAMPSSAYVYRGLCGKLWRVP